MKPLVNKKMTKKLIIIIIITAILSGLLPNFVQAKTDTQNGGLILEPIEKFVVYVCDKVMQWLQTTFTTTDSIDRGDGTYNFQYSPSVIFSGTVPALDINFITPNEDKRNINNYGTYIERNAEQYVPVTTVDSSDYNQKLEALKTKGYTGVIKDCKYYYSFANKGVKYDIYYYIENDTLYIESFGKQATTLFRWMVASGRTCYGSFEIPLTEDFINNLNNTITYESTAAVLQNTIATWYVALRRIALVGLLSVLVYVGIKIVISSSSEEKAKHKNMLKDWLVAICLLFTLHYIMNITLTVTNEISNMFQTGESDELLNTLRQDIYSGKSWGEVLAKVIMYVVIVIFTVTFTMQYLKRVIFMAFFTLIAPLITLTYPLDKIKDGQAQAFNMWIKEYIFTALTQVIHLVIYSVLVSSALELVTDYPLYAIIVMAFIKKAEDLIKKMFGFNKSETVGTLGAAATGGLVMSAINELKSPSKGGKDKGEDSKGSSNNGNVRTATSNPLSALQGANSGANAGTNSGGANVGNQGAVTSTPKADMAGGVKTLYGKYSRTVGKAVLGGLAGGAGAMIGFASGVAQGDLGKALTGAAAGGTAGYGLGQKAVDIVPDTIKGIKQAGENVADTWNEGAHGEGYANTVKFKRSSDYKQLKEKHQDLLTDDKLQEMVEAGITDKGAIDKILSNGGQDIGDAIKHYTIANNCPNEIYYNDKMLKKFWNSTMQTNETDARKIRDMLGKYK